jgi:hypothetical protein
MANKEEIMADIIRCVALDEHSDYRKWRIGVTRDVRKQREELRHPERFQWWQADSLTDAQAVASYFLRVKGMGAAPARDPDRGTYVYIF